MQKAFSVKHLLLTGLFTLATLSVAHATSPAHPDGVNQNMITAQHFTSANYQTQETSKMFPAPSAGMVQHILTLPTLENEANYLVEVQIGQTKLVDCNKHSLRGELQTKDLKGWGYNYYEVAEIAEGPSTMMACFDNAKTEAFVRIPGDFKFAYNSKLPMVFYIPEGAELKYRVWRADTVFNTSGN
ncbi:serine protease inhibitor ecotin [Shewanella litorisediminis]|uniref:Serine protease inhibitor ecotin n=1 Tax=Shewanella litorisediminis TaxID=1173586 RepID=A0ABX7G7V0_9GAMM|nr:serine protease inhibitor ecotin [Shewanella litorisediminis]MCL2919203.1 serine protease inhibitor ecotin [Shewanella litorisediminis]QRH03446.1 serine protease inhibitor ecotin [Shewanella litorisediminis]